MDRGLTRKIKQGELALGNSFRLRKAKARNFEQVRGHTSEVRQESLSKTVGKQ